MAKRNRDNCLLYALSASFYHFLEQFLIQQNKMVIPGDVRRSWNSNDDTPFAETLERVGRNIASASPAQQLGIGGLTGWLETVILFLVQ